VLQLDGERCVEFTDEASGDAIVEVNWADLVQTGRSPLGVALHLWYVLTSMLDLAASGHDGSRARLIRLYRAALLTVTPGAVVFTLATAIAVSFDAWWPRMVLLTLLAAVCAHLASRLQALGRHFGWLWPWVVIVGIVAVAASFGPVPADGLLTRASLKARQIGFLLVFASLALGFLEAITQLPRSSWAPRLARGAFLYLPFIAMNGFMTWLGFLGLSVIARYGVDYANWEATATPPFDYAAVEMAATVVIGAIGVMGVVLPLAGYVLGARGADPGSPPMNRAGRGVQDAVLACLVIAPVALAALAAFSVYVSATTGPTGNSILEVYRHSVWRTVPYAAWFLGPFAIALDVVGDVVFYARPQDRHPAAIAGRCRARLQAALSYAARKFGTRVVILAHSQGSMIAADLRLIAGLDVPLVTVGSPVHSLYRRFLGTADGEAKVLAPWVNGYRDGDFIAGPILRREVTNIHLGRGGHVNYWSDSALTALVANADVPPSRR
jgi:hypothetical protein